VPIWGLFWGQCHVNLGADFAKNRANMPFVYLFLSAECKLQTIEIKVKKIYGR
jgi:hypothetical protein